MEFVFVRSEFEKEVDFIKFKFLWEDVIFMEKKLDELMVFFEVWKRFKELFVFVNWYCN